MKRGQAALLAVVLVAAVGLFVLMLQPRTTGMQIHQPFSEQPLVTAQPATTTITTTKQTTSTPQTATPGTTIAPEKRRCRYDSQEECASKVEGSPCMTTGGAAGTCVKDILDYCVCAGQGRRLQRIVCELQCRCLFKPSAYWSGSTLPVGSIKSSTFCNDCRAAYDSCKKQLDAEKTAQQASDDNCATKCKARFAEAVGGFLGEVWTPPRVGCQDLGPC